MPNIGISGIRNSAFQHFGSPVVRNADYRYFSISEDRSADLGQQEYTKET